MTNVAFWGLNSFLMIVDLTNRPRFLTQYKIQEDKNVPVRTNINVTKQNNMDMYLISIIQWQPRKDA